jgi:CheY-like chemotaxis protein
MMSAMDRATPLLRILVVDDNPDVIYSLSSLLKLTGHKVAAARDGLTAIKLAAEFRPHLVLLDIGMPRMSGYAVCGALRQTDEGQSIMIVAQTAWGQPSDRQHAIEAGFDGHLVKPIDMQQLQEVLAEAAQRASL